MLRVINSYYSNLIEGHTTHPIDIERAMRQDYSGEPAKRALQDESLAHIEVQKAIEHRLESEPDLDLAYSEFIRWVHAQFYQRMPAVFRYVSHPRTGDRLEVIAGAFREVPVEVGLHIAPDAAALPQFMKRFHVAYRLDQHAGGEQRLIVAAAAHHRLGWIHPFLDGNGRVMRLFTDAYLHKTGLEGYGLWNLSRGLARNIETYKARLAQADAQRQGDYDGRCNLSMQGLRDFCAFFLGVCLDQAEYMSEMLRLEKLAERIQGYVDLRVRSLAPAPDDVEKLDATAVSVLHAVLLHGELRRGEAGQDSGFAERKASLVIRQLVSEGLLRSDTPKCPVRLGFPAHVTPYLFPDLIGGVRYI